MKIISLLLFVLSFQLFAESSSVQDVYKNISVKINSSTYNCEYHSSSSIYICPNNNKPILVKFSAGVITAIGRDKNSKTQILSVNEVESRGKTLFKKTVWFPENEDASPEVKFADVISEAKGRIEPVKGFLKNLKSLFMFPSANKNIINSFIEDSEKEQGAFSKIYTEENYSIELEDGQKINCKRGAPRTFTSQQKKQAEETGYPLQCGIFKCDSVTVDGKSYDATLMYESNPYTAIPDSMHLTDKDGIGPIVRVKKINSNQSSTTLVDNTNSILLNNQSTNITSYLAKAIPESVGSEQDRRKIAAYKDPTLNMMLQYYSGICTEDKPLQNLKEARKKLVEKLAQAELAEFIQILGDGSLIGSFIDPNLAPDVGCYYQGVYLNAEAEKNLSRIKKNIHPDQHVDQTISMAKAEELFKKAANMKDIAWKYTADGCYARAHLMARRFEADGVRVDKVWIKGDLYVPDSKISWNFHVAPIVYVEDEKGTVKKIVIDPSLFNRPVTVEEWDAKMAKKTARGSVVTSFPFPENSAFMERSTLSFSSSDPYLPRENINLTEEDKMLRANQIMKLYKMQEPR